MYTRPELRKQLKIGGRGGNFDTGYHQIGKEFLIFCNVGVPGRTGHDYSNQFDGEDLLWAAKNRTAVKQPQIQALLSGAGDVHIFYRMDDRDSFKYLGKGIATDIEDTTPVRLRWVFDRNRTDRNAAVSKKAKRQITVTALEADAGNRSPANYRSRRFDETAVPGPVAAGTSWRTPDEIALLNEKAKAGHHALLVALSKWLKANGWTKIEEIPAAIDLWAWRGNVRVIFEAKTLTAGSELARTRAALAQLLEYRYFHGNDTDHLCLVTDQPISARKLRFLSALSIHCLWYHDGVFTLCGGPSEILAPLAS